MNTATENYQKISFGTRNLIRESYKDWQPRSSPYMYFDWPQIFSPIESLVWNDIRGVGIPFYPQWPVLNYFLDFADPIKKIGIEVDGKEFHQNVEKDMKRQKEIEDEGWIIIRIRGWQAHMKEEFEFDEYKGELKVDNLFDSEGVIRRIKDYFYNFDGEERPREMFVDYF